MQTLPKITVGGDFFLKEPGVEFFYVGISDFGQWKRWNVPTGPENLVRPLFVERRAVADNAGYHGPIVARVFRYSHPGNPFGALPGSTDYSQVNAFMDMAAEYNIYIDWTCGDSQHVLPNTSDQQADLDRFTSNVQRACFVETCNEPFKNGWLPQNGVKPAPSEWYLRDSGNYVFISSTQGWEFQYDLDYISGHFDRTNAPIRWPRWVCDLDDSIATLRSVVGKPSVLKEPTKFGVGYTDPSYAKCLGLRANMGGVTFHSQLGLQSDGFDEATKIAAGAFFKGVVGALG